MIKNKKIILRNLRHLPDDYEMLAQWLGNEVLLEFYHGRDNSYSLARVMEEYSLYTLKRKGITPSIINFEGIDIGYVEFFLLDLQDCKKYQIEYSDSIYEMRLFIGETAYWDKNIGTRIVRTIVEYLLYTEKADKIVALIMEQNKRAIACAKNVGFHCECQLLQFKHFEGEKRDCYLMAIKRI